MNIKSLRLLAGAFLLGVALLAAGQLGTGQTVKAAEPQDVYGTARYDYAFQVLEIVNKERALEGAAPLTMDKDLLSAAMLRSAETVVSLVIQDLMERCAILPAAKCPVKILLREVDRAVQLRSR